MLLKNIKVGLYFILCCLIPIIGNSIEIKLEGLNAELYYNVHKKLSSLDTHIKCVDENLKKKLHDLIKEALRSVGYYSPCINFFFI